MSRRPAMPTTAANQYGAAHDAQIAKHPARIVWRKNTHGILVAVSVQDPNAEQGQLTRGQARQRDRAEAAWLVAREAARADYPDRRRTVKGSALADAARREL